jgi:hypothetical protein
MDILLLIILTALGLAFFFAFFKSVDAFDKL